MEIESGLMAQTHGPSMGLRFIEREIPAGEGFVRTVRILQQLFIPHDWTRYEEEWRDVPLAEPELAEVSQPLPCPWCQTKPEMSWGFIRFYIKCIGKGCPARPMAFGDTKSEAIARWNTRKENERE